MIKKIILLKYLFFLLCSINFTHAHSTENFPKVAIVIPMKNESAYLRTQLTNKKEIVINNSHFIQGKIADREVIFCQTGVGKINAAIATTDLIYHFHPDIILMSGSSGNLNAKIHPGDTVIGTELVNADLGMLTSNGPSISKYVAFNCFFDKQVGAVLKLRPALNKFLKNIQFSKDLPKVYFGRIATSDIDPNPHAQAVLLRDIKVDLVDMEGAAFMQACFVYNTPCVVIRGAGDFIDPDTKHTDKYAGTSASKILIAIIKELHKFKK